MSDETNQKSPALFSTFIMGLASAAMIEMGLIEDPIKKETRKNFPAAKQHIDILEMISVKTQGNLEDEEKSLLDRVLTDLRLQYDKGAESH